MANVVKKQSISFELAQKMVNAAVAKARELGVAENVAILDDGGNLKAFGRMDGVSIPTIEIAQNKGFHCENQGRNNHHVLWFCSNALFMGLRQRDVAMKMAQK